MLTREAMAVPEQELQDYSARLDAGMKGISGIVPEPGVTAEPETVHAAPATPLPEPEQPKYPRLDALRQRVKEIEADAAKVAKYVQAAELLGDVDPHMADKLLTEGAALAGPALTADQQEYLRYAEAHP